MINGLTQRAKEQVMNVINEGYAAQARGKNLVNDNPYNADDPRYWEWRKGYLEAFKDSN